MAYPLGRMVARSMEAIYAVVDGIAFRRPVGKALEEMRLAVRVRVAPS